MGTGTDGREAIFERWYGAETLEMPDAIGIEMGSPQVESETLS